MLQDVSFAQGYWRLLEWKLSSQQLVAFIEGHLACGVDVVDHADIYGNYGCEQAFGDALALAPHLKEQLKIVSKCNISLPSTPFGGTTKHYNSSAGYIRKSVERSLTNLGVEQLDLLLLHRMDYLMEPAEVADIFHALQREGKVAHFGVSNFNTSQYELLNTYFDGLVTNQVEVNPLNLNVLDEGVLDQQLLNGNRPMAWSPLAGGVLFECEDQARTELIAVLMELALKYDVSVDQILYAWVARLPSRPIPIIGSGNLARVASAVASQDIVLSAEDWYRVWSAAKGHDVP